MTRKNLWAGILVISYLFILSSSVNAGFSRFLMGVPFMLLAIIISIAVFGSRVAIGTGWLIFISIFTNATLEKNPLIFPILRGGQIEVLHDAVHITFSGGSGALFEKNYTTSWDEGAVYKPVKRGSVYNVTGVNFSHPDFSSQVNIKTDLGQISERNYKKTNYRHGKQLVKTNKIVHFHLFDRISLLMAWPILFLIYFPLGLIIFIAMLMVFYSYMKKLPKQ